MKRRKYTEVSEMATLAEPESETWGHPSSL